MRQLRRPSLAAELGGFAGDQLARTLSDIEASARGISGQTCSTFITGAGASEEILASAAELKRLAGQVHVAIHALGILRCLPHILEPGETVEALSLGAGNTGRPYDLETDRQIGEFKFISWRGGPESIRQNSLFKDFFLLAEAETEKRKRLYLLGLEQPSRFLSGGRALASVLSKDVKLRSSFAERYGDRYATVRDYFQDHSRSVELVDVSPFLPELVGVGD